MSPKFDLLAHADTKDGNLPSEMLNRVTADARVGTGMARARADDQLCGLFCDQFIQRNLVISEDGHIGALEHQVLVDIPSEGIVVVNQYKVGCSWHQR